MMGLSQEANLQAGYLEQPKKLRPFLERLSTKDEPQSGQGMPLEMGFVLLHSGYLEHAKNLPNRPRLMVMGEPHLSQISSVVSTGATVMTPFSSFLNSRVPLQSGYPVHDKNSPFLPNLITMGFPHLSHLISVFTSWRLISFIATLALDKVELKVL